MSAAAEVSTGAAQAALEPEGAGPPLAEPAATEPVGAAPAEAQHPEDLPAGRRVYSVADQAERFERAKAEGNQRFLDINSVYDASYLKGKRVLVTGAHGGLGHHMAKELLAQGAEVIATIGAEALEVEPPERMQMIENVRLNEDDSVEKMAQAITAPLDYVINNAGYLAKGRQTLATLSLQEDMAEFDMNALGPLRLISALHRAGHLQKAKVVLINNQEGSIEWRFTQIRGVGGDYGHHMSRAACNMAAVLMAEELRDQGIPIVVLHPGLVRTGYPGQLSQAKDLGTVDVDVAAKRVLHEMGRISMDSTGTFINCEDGLLIPW